MGQSQRNVRIIGNNQQTSDSMKKSINESPENREYQRMAHSYKPRLKERTFIEITLEIKQM